MSAPVTVAVVSWNTRELLGRCLRSLRADHDAARAEVWVVDNASGDGSAELVAAEFPWARLLRCGENLGFGPAVNRVAAETSAPWLALANADTAPEPGALAALLAAGERDPGAGALAPRLLLPDGSTQHSVHPFPTLALTAAFNLGLVRRSRRLGDRLCLEGHWDPERAREVDWALGAFLLVRRSAFDTIGGFDERLRLYAEDLDLCWRLARTGWRTRYEPAARVVHEQSAAAQQAFGPDQTAQWMGASYAWLRLRRGRALARATATLNIAGAGARATLYGAAARAAPGRFAAARDLNRRWLRAHREGWRAGGGPLDRRSLRG